MTREEYINHYVKHYAQVGEDGAGTNEYIKKLALWVGIGYQDGMSVLDYGAGTGAMAPCIENIKDYIGCDIVPQAVEIARKKYPEYRFLPLSIGEFACPKKDFVAAMSVFTHARYEDFYDCLLDLKRNMKKTGFGCVDILAGPRNNDPHITYWEKEEFRIELARAGFNSQEVLDITWPNGFTHTYFKITHV